MQFRLQGATLVKFAVYLSLAAVLPPDARAQSTRRVFIEGFRAHDSLSLLAAVALRAELPRHIRVDSVHIMTTTEIDAMRSAGAPDDFGGAWSWQDVREAARVYRANAVVDVEARYAASGVRIAATRVPPNGKAPGVALPAVVAGTLQEAVFRLAQQLATDSVLVGRQSRPSTSPPNVSLLLPSAPSIRLSAW